MILLVGRGSWLASLRYTSLVGRVALAVLALGTRRVLLPPAWAPCHAWTLHWAAQLVRCSLRRVLLCLPAPRCSPGLLPHNSLPGRRSLRPRANGPASRPTPREFSEVRAPTPGRTRPPHSLSCFHRPVSTGGRVVVGGLSRAAERPRFYCRGREHSETIYPCGGGGVHASGWVGLVRAVAGDVPGVRLPPVPLSPLLAEP